MIDFFKKIFKSKKDNYPIIFLTLKNEKTVLYIDNGNTHNMYPCSIQVSNKNNVSKITNIMSVNEIKRSKEFNDFSVISTENRFRNYSNLHDIEILMGNEFISMTNNDFDFSYIFSLGDNISIPASGISVNTDVYNIIKNLIKDKKCVFKVGDFSSYSNVSIERDVDIDAHQKSGTKICKCSTR